MNVDHFNIFATKVNYQNKQKRSMIVDKHEILDLVAMIFARDDNFNALARTTFRYCKLILRYEKTKNNIPAFKEVVLLSR